MKKFLVNDILVDPHSNEAVKNEQTIRLEPKTMELLNFLALNPRQTVTKEEILQNVWAGTIVSEDSIARCVSQLRKVFDNNSEDRAMIETISKKGYRLNANVHFLDNESKNVEAKEKPRPKGIPPILAGIITGCIALGSVYGVGTIMRGQGIAIVLAAFFLGYVIFYYLRR